MASTLLSDLSHRLEPDGKKSSASGMERKLVVDTFVSPSQPRTSPRNPVDMAFEGMEEGTKNVSALEPRKHRLECCQTKA